MGKVVQLAPPQHPPPRGATAEERLNNAIARMDFVAHRSEFSRIRQPITDLAIHWLKYWADRKAFQDPTKVANYLKWYTRAYMLFPADSRVLLTKPETIDVRYTTMVREEIARTKGGLGASAKAASAIPEGIDRMARRVDTLASEAVSAVQPMTIALIVIAGGLLLSGAFSRKSRR